MKPIDVDGVEIILTIPWIMTDVHKTAIQHGWWENHKEDDILVIPEKLMLIVTEVAEAMEEYRNGTLPLYYKDGKPEGITVELADVIIRICDLCEEFGFDLQSAIIEKMIYNDQRPYRHGGKRV